MCKAFVERIEQKPLECKVRMLHIPDVCSVLLIINIHGREILKKVLGKLNTCWYIC